MPQIRCPECGAVNDTRAADYPYCVGCQDNLAKCGYCHWFDGRAAVCANIAVDGEFEIGREATPPCGHHAPRSAMYARREGRLALLAIAGLVAAVFALGYGFFRLLQPITPPPDPVGQLQLRVEADYRPAAVGQVYAVKAEIYNDSDVAVGGVRFEISKEFLEQFVLSKMSPRPSGSSQSSQWRVFFYPDMNPREQRRVTLELVPKQSGTYHLKLQVASGETAKHGMADFPVRVKSR